MKAIRAAFILLVLLALLLAACNSGSSNAAKKVTVEWPGGSASLYSTPGKLNVVGTVVTGTTCDVLEEDDFVGEHVYRVKCGTLEGWVSGKFVTED